MNFEIKFNSRKITQAAVKFAICFLMKFQTPYETSLSQYHSTCNLVNTYFQGYVNQSKDQFLSGFLMAPMAATL